MHRRPASRPAMYSGFWVVTTAGTLNPKTTPPTNNFRKPYDADLEKDTNAIYCHVMEGTACIKT